QGREPAARLGEIQRDQIVIRKRDRRGAVGTRMAEDRHFRRLCGRLFRKINLPQLTIPDAVAIEAAGIAHKRLGPAESAFDGFASEDSRWSLLVNALPTVHPHR